MIDGFGFLLFFNRKESSADSVYIFFKNTNIEVSVYFSLFEISCIQYPINHAFKYNAAYAFLVTFDIKALRLSF